MKDLRGDNASQEDMINKFNEIEEITVDEIKTYWDSKEEKHK